MFRQNLSLLAAHREHIALYSQRSGKTPRLTQVLIFGTSRSTLRETSLNPTALP